MIALRVIVIGGGPAGLAAAAECLQYGNEVLLFEANNQVGGISKTVWMDGYGFDVGGHRFFTRNADVMRLWRDTLGSEFTEQARSSSIVFEGRRFSYPISISDVVRKSTTRELAAILRDYMAARLKPIRPEESLEVWCVNRFGRKLYKSFFQSYTEKLWGMPCSEISADWAEQRIQGLSVGSVLRQAITGRNVTKSMIQRFWYPRKGPGQMYEAMAAAIVAKGGQVTLGARMSGIEVAGGKVEGIWVQLGGESVGVEGDVFISTLPLDELVRMTFGQRSPLRYRCLLTVNLIFDGSLAGIADNWLYLHGTRTRAARLQYPFRWSPALLPEGRGHSLSLEYFCSDSDDLWSMDNKECGRMAAEDVKALGFIGLAPVGHGVVRVGKAYPVYYPGYEQTVNRIRRQMLPATANLFTVGRSGQYRYNNMDHSILTGIYAARRANGATVDEWAVNEEKVHCEQ